VVPFPLPPGGLEAIRVIVGGLPAVILVIGGILLLLLGFFFGPGRQRYAREAASSAFSTARVLIGLATDHDG
jgi:hypothetical protein